MNNLVFRSELLWVSFVFNQPGKSNWIKGNLEIINRTIILVEIKDEMAQADVIRNGIIDKLLAISDKEYLMALLRLVDNSAVQDERIKLSKEQKLMLEMSEADILGGQTISQNDLDRNDLEWLNGK